MALDEKELYNKLAVNLSSLKLKLDDISSPDPTVESEVTGIYTQAREHRNRLVWFYIGYTVVFTIYVLGLIAWQGYIRVDNDNDHFEIIPQWGLNLLVVGMFAQFIGLLKIVTERVWDFKELLAHHFHLMTGKSDQDDDTDDKENPN